VTFSTADWGLGGGTHVCLVHDSPLVRARVLERRITAANERNERVLVLSESAENPQLTELLAPDAFDETRLREELEAEKRLALDAGFNGILIVSDVTWAATPGGVDGDALAAYERAVTAVLADGRESAVCQYDRSRFGSRTIAGCAATHPVLETAFDETDTLRNGQVTLHLGRHGTVRAQGEIDMANADLLERALVTARERSHNVCVDVSELTFIDLRGVHALFAAARTGDIALLAPSSPLRGILRALDARGGLPGLQVG
jgi:anti-anti-sigma regulatory factor